MSAHDGGGEQRPEVRADLVVLERSRLLAALWKVLVAAGALAIAGFVLQPFGPAFLGIYALIAGLTLRAAVEKRNVRAARTSASVVVSARGVEVTGPRGARVVPKEVVADGFFQPRVAGKYGSSVRLVDKRRRVLFEAETSEERALEMLQVLGLDPGSRRAEFSGASPIYATVTRQMAWTFGLAAAFFLVTGVARIGGPAAAYLLLPLLFAGTWPSKITVGVDGVLVRWLWSKTFTPMSEIRSVTREGERGIAIERVSGERQVITTGTRRKNRSPAQGEHRDAVLARMQEALSTFRSRGPIADVAALVARGARTRADWLDALRKLAGRRDGGYRDAVVRDEDLFRLVEDPRAPEDARAGAALVLGRSLDEIGKARVRVAAEATASPRLRVVLDAAARAQDESALEEALGEIAEEPAAGRAAAKRVG